jgi:hypothetical protein
MSDLSAHLSLCNHQRSAWFSWHCKADAIRAFLLSRVVTTGFGFALIASVVTDFVK